MKDTRLFIPNDYFFGTWSKEMAYVLGYLAADGHITKNGRNVTFTSKDIDLIENIKLLLDYNGKTYIRKENDAGNVIIASTQMYSDLTNFGFDNHKSITLKWIPNIPNEYLNHFVRGYLDGDGSIYFQKAHNPNFRLLGMNFVGTVNFITGLKNSINKTLNLENRGHINLQPMKEGGHYALLFYRGVEQVKIILDWIYYNSVEETRLNRKYQLYYDYFYATDEYKKYREHADNFQQNRNMITYELAQKIRQDSLAGLNQQQISEKHNINRCTITPILSEQTHTNTDNRTNNASRYFEIRGEIKHEIDICKEYEIDLSTFRYRINTLKMSALESATLPPDKGENNPRTTMYEAFGKVKSLLQWSQDSRCYLSYSGLKNRVEDLGMTMEEALLATTEEIKKPTIENQKTSSSAVVNWDIAKQIREEKIKLNCTNAELARKFGVSQDIIKNIILNRTWIDTNYNAINSTKIIKINYNDKEYTIKEFSELTGIPYGTVDRKIREGKKAEEIISPAKIVKTKNAQELEKVKVAKEIRNDYKSGLKMKDLMEKYSLSKSRYMDIILNRTFVEENVWWKETV